MTETQHTDVLIVGAGVSGIGAACRLEKECPQLSYAILERRQAIGGTWDLFRFPGVRSDSDMFTFGYDFRPWNDVKVFADGPSIRQYVADTAREFGVDRRISYGLKVVRASFDSRVDLWTVEALHEESGELRAYTCRFVIACSGYYDYDQGFRPQFPGEERFGGTLVHPQFWPADLDWTGKRVVVIGSGATAITIVPAMAEAAAHVTMLQRSPTYIVSLPAVDKISLFLQRFLPAQAVYRQARTRNVLIQRLMYALSRRRPEFSRKLMLAGVRRHLGPDADLTDFTPSYFPWDQRLCVVPDGDLFATVRSGRADLVTDTIDTFTEAGIRLTSGKELPADIVVTATGLNVQLLGGADLVVDGEPVLIDQRVTYKGVMLEGVPNAAIVFGYINASWTLKADIANEYVCRLLNHMDAEGFTRAVARATDRARGRESVLGALDAGYVRRGNAKLPRQGTGGPWVVTNNFLHDARMLRKGPLEDGILELRRTAKVAEAVGPTS
jgi:cation diffusion facilitator CzcD-associated flavoprotein CzcO